MLFVLVNPGLARGEPARAVRLEYERLPDAAQCPDAEVLGAAVTSRLGFNPFREPATERIQVRVAAEAGALRATVTLDDLRGAELGRRELTGDLDCVSLSAQLELTLGLALDPSAQPLRRRPVEAHAAPPEKAPPAESPPPGWYLAAGGGVSLGASPRASATVAVEGGVRLQRISVGFEAQAQLPGSVPFREGFLQTYAASFTALPCLHTGAFALCGAVGGGAWFAAARDLEGGREVSSGLMDAGARLQWAPFDARLGLRLHLDGRVHLARPRLVMGEETAWSMPLFSAGLGLTVLVTDFWAYDQSPRHAR